MTMMMPRLQRRLAAILAADLVGYSRMMMADERGTFLRVQALLDGVMRPCIEAHGGRVFKLMGDGILAEFPSVVDAVVAALEIQDRLAARAAVDPPEARLMLRIGLNLGDVIDHERDLYGQGINLAARVEALAPPGGICITRAVREEVRDKLDLGFEDCGEIAVKNISRPVRVFRLRHGGAEPRPAEGPAPRRRAGAWPIAAVVALTAVFVVVDRPHPPELTEAQEARTAQPARVAVGAGTIATLEGLVFATTPSNLRSGPGTRFAIVGGALTGQALELTGEAVTEDERWYRVRGPGEGGAAFIHSRLVDEAPPRAVPDLALAPAPEPAGPAEAEEPVIAAVAPLSEPDLAPRPAEPVPVSPLRADPVPDPMPESLAIRITLDFSGHWSSCLPIGGDTAHRLEVAPDGRWQRLHLAGAEDVNLRARARPDASGGVVVSVLPFSHHWPEADAITVALPSTAPGTRGRAVSRRSSIEPMRGCGRVVAFLDIVD